MVDPMEHLRQDKPELAQRLQALPQYLAQYSDIVTVYLFGSHATAEASPLSDIDIAYLLDAPDLDRELEIEAAITRALGTDDVDVQVLNKAPVPFQYAVITSGTVLYNRTDQERQRFESHIRDTYEANKDQYEVTREDLLQSLG